MNDKKSAESQLSTSTFDLNSKNRNEKIQIALSEQEETTRHLQEKISKEKKIIEYVIEHFWNPLEIHGYPLVSFNGKIFVSNFPLRRIDKFEKMDDFAIELFNTPLLNKYIKLSDGYQICELPFTIETLDKLSNESNNYLYLNYSNDVVFTGSTGFKWIKDDVAPNQLLNTIDDNINCNSINSRENKLKVREFHLFQISIQFNVHYTIFVLTRWTLTYRLILI